jgi:hypothetical protein
VFSSLNITAGAFRSSETPGVTGPSLISALPSITVIFAGGEVLIVATRMLFPEIRSGTRDETEIAVEISGGAVAPDKTEQFVILATTVAAPIPPLGIKGIRIKKFGASSSMGRQTKLLCN